MSEHLLGLAPYLLHQRPLVAFHTAVTAPASSIASSSSASLADGPGQQRLHRVVQVVYDYVAEDVVLLTSTGLLCFYAIRQHVVPATEQTNRAAGQGAAQPSPLCEPALSVQLPSDPRRAAPPHPLLAFARRQPPGDDSCCPYLIATGDGKAGQGTVHLYASRARRSVGGVEAKGTYACVPRSLRFPGGTQYPVLDVVWPAPSTPGTWQANASERTPPRCLVCVTPVSLDLLALTCPATTSSSSSTGEVHVRLLQRYTTHTDRWFYSPSTSLLWCLNAAKPTVVKPFWVSDPLQAAADGGSPTLPQEAEAMLAASSSWHQDSGRGRARQVGVPRSRRAGIVACPKLQLTGNGRELFAGPSAPAVRPLRGAGISFTHPGASHDHLVGTLTLYGSEAYLYHTQLEKCRIVLYRYNGPSQLHASSSHTGSGGGISVATTTPAPIGNAADDGYPDAYSVRAVLSLIEFPSVREYAEQSSSPSSGGVPAPLVQAPSVAVQCVDNVILVHSINDQLTSSFDIAVDYQRRRELAPPPGWRAASRQEGTVDAVPHPHALRLSAAVANAPSSEVWTSEHIWGTARAREGSGAGLLAGQHVLHTSAPSSAARSLTAPPSSPAPPLPAFGEDTPTWQAHSLDTSEARVLMPLLTASLDLLPPLEPAAVSAAASAEEAPLRWLFTPERVGVFIPTAAPSQLPLRFSFPKPRPGADRGPEKDVIAVQLVDLNPVSVALASSLSEAVNSSRRIAFLLRRRAFLSSQDLHKQAVVELLLAALSGKARPSSPSPPPPQRRSPMAGDSAPRNSSPSPIPQTSMLEMTGALEALAWHGAWAHEVNSRTSRWAPTPKGRPDAGSQSSQGKRVRFQLDNHGSESVGHRVAAALLVHDPAYVRRESREAEEEERGLGSAVVPALSVVTTPAEAAAADTAPFEGFSEEEIVQQLLPVFSSSTVDAPDLSEAPHPDSEDEVGLLSSSSPVLRREHDGGARAALNLEVDPLAPPRLHPQHLQERSTASGTLTAFWGLVDYVHARMLSNGSVGEVTVLPLLDTFQGLVQALTAAAASRRERAVSVQARDGSAAGIDIRSGEENEEYAAMMQSYLSEAAHAVSSVLLHAEASSSSHPLCTSTLVASKLLELSCCYDEYNSQRVGEAPARSRPHDDVAAVARQRCLGGMGTVAASDCRDAQQLFFVKAVRTLQAAASTDAVVESVRLCLEHQQPLMATRVLREYILYCMEAHPQLPKHPQRQQQPHQSARCRPCQERHSDPETHVGGGTIAVEDENILAECMYVVLRGAAEAVDAHSLAHHMHTIAHRGRYSVGNGSNSAIDHVTTADALAASEEEVESRARWRASCLQYTQCFEEIASLLLLMKSADEEAAEPVDGVLTGVPKGLAGFTEKYNHLIRFV